MKGLIRRSVGLILPAAGFVAWWLVTNFRLIPRLFLPSPAEVILAARDIGPALWSHAAATLLRLVVGFGLGFLVGYILGILMVLYRPARRTLGPAVDSARPAPSVATLPFFLLWFGFALYGQVLFIAVGVTLIVASAVVDAARAVPPHLIRAAQTFQATRWQLARTVLMPGLLPQLVPTLRICLGIGGSLTIASEFMGADYGIGVLLDLSRRTLRTEGLVLFTFVLGVLVTACDLILRAVLAYHLRWLPVATEVLDHKAPSPLRERCVNRHG
jgi:ABC-type nitrate/sulfonate/bicarbonate transport system permease component